MPNNSQLLSIQTQTLQIAREIARTRQICRLSAELLKGSAADTFLGRSTQAAVPAGGEEVVPSDA